MVFKGFTYSFLLYDNSHIRPYSDIDILVEEKNYKATESHLNQLRYQRFESRQGQFISYQNSFYNNSTPQTIIDLHWQINNRIEIHPHFKFKQLYQSAKTIQTTKYHFKTLNVIDAFILACFHYKGHRPDDRKHIWLYDLALLWNSMDNQTHEECFHVAKQKQQSNIINAMLIQLNQTFPQCFETIESNIEMKESTEVYLNKRKRKLTDISIRFKNIKGVKNKLIFISEYVFQSKSYVQNRYQLKSKKIIYFYYPRMWIEDIFKLFK